MTLQHNVIPALGITDAKYKVVIKAGLTSLLTSKSSWLERLFLQKCHEVYPDLVDKKYDLTFTRDDSELNTDLFGVVGSERLCTQRMSDYVRTLRAYTGNACLWDYKWGDDAHCKPDDTMNTWSVLNRRASGKSSQVTFPCDTEHNMSTWRTYFTGNRIWDDGILHELFNLYWRNTLIPAHEVVHLFATNQQKFAQIAETQACERNMSKDDLLRRRLIVNRASRIDNVQQPPHVLGNAYHDEWTASVANANIFILHMRQHYLQSNNPRHRSIHQLHVVHGMLYIVALLRRMRNSVDALTSATEKASAVHILNLGVRWTLLSIEDKESIASVIRSVTTCGWPNTYLKHISALMYALNFFQEDDSSDFVNSILTAEIWQGGVYQKYKSRIIRQHMWEVSNIPRPIAGWILERSYDQKCTC